MINIKLNNEYLNDILDRANKIFVGESKYDDADSYKGNGLLSSIETAKEEMRYADDYFECVTDPDLIDHTIYYREAARKKYTYLLKLAKRQGLVKAE